MTMTRYDNYDDFEKATGTYVPLGSARPGNIVGPRKVMKDWGHHFDGLGTVANPTQPGERSGRWVVGFHFDHADVNNTTQTGVLLAFELADEHSHERKGRVVVIRDPWTTADDGQWRGQFQQGQHTLEDIDNTITP